MSLGAEGPFLWLPPCLQDCCLPLLIVVVSFKERLQFLNPQENVAVTSDSSRQLTHNGEAAGRELLCHGNVPTTQPESLSCSKGFCPVRLN